VFAVPMNKDVGSDKNSVLNILEEDIVISVIPSRE
jgi:hypothetical protein